MSEATLRSRMPWRLRVFDALSTYLPLLLMAVLALGTWWLVKNTPLFENGRAGAPLRHEPDYTMKQFLVQRFGADGAMRVQIEGDLLRHYPDTDTFEIDNPRIRAIADDGRVTTAAARLALSNRDGSEVQLTGGAHVVREGRRTPAGNPVTPSPADASATELPIDFKGNFLQYFQYAEQVRSHLPVVVTQGGNETHADSMAYDNLTRVLDLKGHVHTVLASTPASATASATAFASASAFASAPSSAAPPAAPSAPASGAGR